MSEGRLEHDAYLDEATEDVAAARLTNSHCTHRISIHRRHWLCVGQAAVRAVLVVKLNVASQDANELVATDDQLLAEVEQGLGRLATKPVLIVWGDKDPGSKERHRLRWEHTFPNHRTHILRGASHYIQEDAPEEIVAAIKAWWPGPASGE